MPQADTDWCRDYSNVLELAKHLDDECEFNDTAAMLRYFQKPWKWTPEWWAYQNTKAQDSLMPTPVVDVPIYDPESIVDAKPCDLCGNALNGETDVHAECARYEACMADLGGTTRVQESK